MISIFRNSELIAIVKKNHSGGQSPMNDFWFQETLIRVNKNRRFFVDR